MTDLSSSRCITQIYAESSVFQKHSTLKLTPLIHISSITLSTSGAVPYRYKLFRYSLDRYGPACVHTCSGTVLIHLSILWTEQTKLYRNSLFRNEPYKLLGFGSERIGTEWAMHLQVWTGGAVPFRYCTDPKTLVWTGYMSAIQHMKPRPSTN